MSIQEKIQSIINENKLVLFMKGTSDFPQCGFSGKVVHILQLLGVNYLDVNVLENPNLRQGIKDFSQWPMIPQLYARGQFIGGCDIVSELYQNGKLQEQLK